MNAQTCDSKLNLIKIDVKHADSKIEIVQEVVMALKEKVESGRGKATNSVNVGK